MSLEQDETLKEDRMGEGGSQPSNAAPFLFVLFSISLFCSLVHKLSRRSNCRSLVFKLPNGSDGRKGFFLLLGVLPRFWLTLSLLLPLLSSLKRKPKK